jgi:hypothetical protein
MKWIVPALFVSVAVLNIAAIESPKPVNDYKNLQVLPADISSKDLQSIMVDEFQDGLGVGCGYCHVQEKNSIHLDYASDEKPEKEIARVMMRMTLQLNKDYFGVEKPLLGSSAMTVSCFSCHRGTPHPESE